MTSDFERVGLGAVRVLLLTCATVGAAVGQRGADAAAERVEAAFRRGDPVEARAARLEAVTAVPASGSAALVEVLCDAWTACHHMALKVEREVLDQNRRGGAKRAADERETFDALLATMWAIEGRLERFDDPAAAAALFECGVLDDDLAPQLRVIAAAAAGPMGKAGAERVAAQLTRARRADDRWILLRALQAIGGAARFAGPDVSEQLTHESTMVRSQAARTLAAIGHRPSAKAMIDRLDVERGQAQRVLMASLVVLAKRDLGPVPASWRAWWQAEGEDFVAGRLPPPKQVEGARAKGEPRTVTFFGVPQDDRRILYVLDASLSMRQKLSGSGRAKAGEESRWDRLLVEARKAFEGLSPEQEFGVLVFGDTMQAWQPKLVPATPRAVAEAADWLDAVQLELGTNVFGGLDEAYAMVGPQIRDRYFEAGCDAMLFLTDGRPTRRDPSRPNKLGQDDTELIRALVRRRDPFDVVPMHTIAFGKGAFARFTRELARDTGGESMHVK